MAEKSQTIWIGLDVGKKDFHAAIDLAIDGRLELGKLPARCFQRTESGAGALLKWAAGLAPASELRIVMETTGCYSIQLEKWLRQLNPAVSVSIQNGRQVSDFIKSLNLPHKTDQSDAQAIARFGTERTPAPVKPMSLHWEELRELERERSALVKVRNALTNRAESLEKSFTRKINGRAIAALTTQIDALEKEIMRCVKSHDDMYSEAKIMVTAPGVSFTSAAGFLAEFGSLKQYRSRQLSALSGLVPRNSTSGTSVHKSHLSRRGSKRARQLLYMDSMQAVNKIPHLNALYQRLISQGKKPMTARCACMRKLLLILRAMVEQGKPYDEKYFRNISSAS